MSSTWNTKNSVWNIVSAQFKMNFDQIQAHLCILSQPSAGVYYGAVSSCTRHLWGELQPVDAQ